MTVFILIISLLIGVAIAVAFVDKAKGIPQAKLIKDIGKRRPYMPTQQEKEAEMLKMFKLAQERENQRDAYTDWHLEKYSGDIDYTPNVTLGNLYREGEIFNVDTTDMLPYDKNRIYRIFGNQIVKANQNGKDFAIYGIDLAKENDGKFSAKGFKKADKGFIDPMGNTISLDFAKLVTVENNNLTTYGISASVSYDGNKIYFTLKGRDANKLVLLWGK